MAKTAAQQCQHHRERYQHWSSMANPVWPKANAKLQKAALDEIAYWCPIAQEEDRLTAARLAPEKPIPVNVLPDTGMSMLPQMPPMEEQPSPYTPIIAAFGVGTLAILGLVWLKGRG